MYPVFVWGKQRITKEKTVINTNHVVPPLSFYSLSTVLNNGHAFSFEALRGKKVLLVNTASDCGYTPQYAELQKLYEALKDELQIIAFPANDFKEQEKGSDAEIAAFCSKNYGVSFPIAKKAIVINHEGQHPVFRWLSDQQLNGWNSEAPSWNFSKYLVNDEGILTHYFDPSVSPLSKDVLDAVHGQGSSS